MIYKQILYSRAERAGESTRNLDTAHFFVEEGEPASEVDASTRHHRDGDAAFVVGDKPGAYGDVRRRFLRIYVYSMSFYQ